MDPPPQIGPICPFDIELSQRLGGFHFDEDRTVIPSKESIVTRFAIINDYFAEKERELGVRGSRSDMDARSSGHNMITPETTWDVTKLDKDPNGLAQPFMTLAYGQQMKVDPNPPLYRSRHAREGWTTQDYLDYMAKIPAFQYDSLDDDVIASRVIFYQDYFACCNKSS